MRRIAFLALLIATPAAAFRKGPYVQAVGPDRAVVLWEAESNAPAQVKVHGPKGFERTVVAEAADGVYRAAVTGLAPGARYTYEVAQGTDHAQGRIQTPPAPGMPFTFVVYGDDRTDDRAHQAIADAILKTGPDVLIHTGDMVERGDRPADWDVFFHIERKLLAGAPLYVVPGNHENIGGGFSAFHRWFELPGNEEYYAFDWGNVRFVAIDANHHVDDDGAPDAEQMAFLEKAIRGAHDDPHLDHVVAFVHQGPFSTQPSRHGNDGLRRVLPQLQADGLSLIVSGHDHFYERGVSKDGLPYIVSGASGAPLYESRGPGDYGDFKAIVQRTAFSFVRLRSAGPSLSGCAIDLDGTSFDCFDLGRPAVGARDPGLR